MLTTDPQQREITSQAEARVVSELETAQRRTVTTPEVALMIGAPVASQRVRDVIAQLRKHGWLVSLPLRGTYEFQPAVGGPYPSGDSWLELRVALARNPAARAHVGLGSAAFLRHLSDRRPVPDTVVWLVEQPVPPGLLRAYRVVRCAPDRFFGSSLVDALPVATPERIALEVALWPGYAGDLRSPEHWMRDVLQHVNIDALADGARRLGPAVTGRLGYLAERFDVPAAAAAIAELPRTHPIWLGSRATPEARQYDSRWGVYDTIGVAGAA
jgi:predicted transcriptional regulator of viral defense system